MTASIQLQRKPEVQYLLRIGDTALILAQRLGAWSACAPELEEDMALTNIALDLLGQARNLLTIAGERLAARVQAWDDGAWVRDAAMAHARKHAMKEQAA